MDWLVEKLLFQLEFSLFLMTGGLWLVGGIVLMYNGVVPETSEMSLTPVVCAYAAFIGIPHANLYIVENQGHPNVLSFCFALGGPVFVLASIVGIVYSLGSSASPIDLIPLLLSGLLVGAIGRYQQNQFG